MLFGSHGSFDPTEIGFYTSIGAGIVWYILSNFLFKRFLVEKPDEK
jgi:hypothetical protein